MVLDRLSSQAGHWHELARLLPGLAAAGYDGTAIEERCGIERSTQGRWVISLSVRAPCCRLAHPWCQTLALCMVDREDLLACEGFLAFSIRSKVPTQGKCLGDLLGHDAQRQAVLLSCQ